MEGSDTLTLPGARILIAFLLTASPAYAACPSPSAGSATYQVVGVVTAVAPFPVPFVLPGDPFTATFAIDPSTADTESDPTIGDYPGAVSCYTFTIGGNLVQGSGRVVVRNLLGVDDVFVGDTAPMVSLGGLLPFQFTLTRLDDASGTALANDALPVLTEFSPVSTQQFILGFVDPSLTFAFVVGDITSIQVDRALTLTKDASPSSTGPGGTILYSLTAQNVGSLDAAAVVISDIVPPNTTYVAGSASDGGSESAGVVSWPAISLAPAQSVMRTVSFQVDPGLIVPPPDFSDDMEAGTASWTTSNAPGSGSANWELVGTNPHSGAFSWFGEDVTDLSDQLLAVSAPILVPSGASQLEFFHDYDLEQGFDGGVVEISTDGVLWTDLGPNAIENPYDGTISTCCLNAIGGDPAYTGSSGGFIRSSFDLSTFAGSQVRVRFRLATDESLADVGWWVDDVVVRVPVQIVNDALAEPAEGSAASASRVIPIPEPSGWMLLIAGLFGLAAIGRQRDRA